jgi:hypothetical protein
MQVRAPRVHERFSAPSAELGVWVQVQGWLFFAEASFQLHSGLDLGALDPALWTQHWSWELMGAGLGR